MNINFAHAQKNFIADLKKKNRASATILAYGADIRQLANFLALRGKKSPNQVSREDLEAFKAELTVQKYTNKSISRKINSIKTFFSFLGETGNLESNPAVSLSSPTFENKPPKVLTKMEYRALRDVCRSNQRIYAIVELFLQTGIKIGELANLRLEDITPEKILIRSDKSHQKREIPLNKAAWQALQNWLKVRLKTKVKDLFVTKTGKPFLIRNIRTALQRYFRLAGIQEAKVNDLRHTFIAHQLQAGTPLVVVSKLAGHKRISTTEKYLKYLPEKSSSVKVKLEEL